MTLQDIPDCRGQHMRILFNNEVNDDSIHDLCMWIRRGIYEYYYSHIILEINSPGGSANSLLYFINMLKMIRKEKGKEFVLQTVASMQSCSAAALMLSLGTIGFRSTQPDSRLVYHNARINMRDSVSTGDRFSELSADCKRLDKRMLIELCRHLYPAIKGDIFDLLETCYCELGDTKQQAHFGRLKLFRKKAITSLVDKIQKLSDKDISLEKKLHNTVSLELAEIEDKSDTSLSYEKDFENNAKRISFVNQIGWLLKQFEVFNAVFSEDRILPVNEAIELSLVDTIDKTISL